MAVAATIILLSEPTRNKVDVVTGAPLTTFFLPTPEAKASLPCNTTAMLTPGVKPAVMNR